MPAVVAVTGAASQLGEHLVGLLEADDRVERIVCLDVVSPQTSGQKTTLVHTDLASDRAPTGLIQSLLQERVDTVVHLAFRSSPHSDTIGTHDLESVGTMHLANACRGARVRKLVMSSQTMLYGARPDNPNFLSEHQPLNARRQELFFGNKMDAEEEVTRFGRPGSGRIATILRSAPILGPTVSNALSRYLSHPRVPTVLGFDPLWQLLHEADALAAVMLALEVEAVGTFNIASGGVLPLSKLVTLAGRKPIALPRIVVEAAAGALWAVGASEAPPSFIDYLQYVCVADTGKAERILGFVPFYTAHQAVAEFAAAQRLREVRLTSKVSQ